MVTVRIDMLIETFIDRGYNEGWESDDGVEVRGGDGEGFQ